MRHCIFCHNALSAKTKPEHILHNALGGRKTTRIVICSDCNGLFGSTIDKELAKQVEVIRNLLQLPSGSKKPPPQIRGVQAGSETLDIHSDGTPVPRGKPFSIDMTPDGKFAVEIRASSPEELANFIPHIAAQVGCSEEQLKAQLLATGRVARVARRPEGMPFSIALGGRESLPSIVKSCLVLWSTLVGNEEVRPAGYLAARRFALGSNPSFNEDGVRLDSRRLPCAGLLEQRFGKLFNLIYIESNPAGNVVAHFTLYNVISWRIALSEQGPPNLKIALASNPLEPGIWSDSIANELNIGPHWLDQPDYDLDHARARFVAMMELYVETSRSRALDQIINEVFSAHGLTDMGPISDPDLQKRIIGAIAHKATLHFLHLPDEQVLTESELANLVMGISVRPSKEG